MVILSDKLGICGDAVMHRREWVSRAQPQRPLGDVTGFPPPSAIAQREAVNALRHREVLVEPERQFELGQCIIDAGGEIAAAKRGVCPGVLAVDSDCRERGPLCQWAQPS